MNDIFYKYLDSLKKLSTYIEHKFGVKPTVGWIDYNNVVDIAIELLESQKFEVNEYEPWMEDVPEWFKIQTVNPDRNLVGDTVYCVRKIEEIEE